MSLCYDACKSAGQCLEPRRCPVRPEFSLTRMVKGAEAQIARVEKMARKLASIANPGVSPDMLVYSGEPFRVRLPASSGVDIGYGQGCEPARQLWTYYRVAAEAVLKEAGDAG